MRSLQKYYQKAGLSALQADNVVGMIKAVVEDCMEVIVQCELCFYVESKNDAGLGKEEHERLMWVLTQSFKEDSLSCSPWISANANNELDYLVEIGPRLNFSTAFSTNAVSICRSIGIDSIKRIEKSTRYLIRVKGKDSQLIPTNVKCRQRIANVLHDKMTECVYSKPLENFHINTRPDDCYEIDIFGRGKMALEEANKVMGLSFTEWDIDIYYNIFKEKLQRNPTSVECFDLAQSNSEHSRHWFFKGKMIIDNEVMADSLMKMVMGTQDTTNPNSLIKFSDNSSAIKGFKIKTLIPKDSSEASYFIYDEKRTRHFTLTAETHNFPTGVAPFPGATTGTGGRIRDNHATGIGAHVIAGSAGYCFGNLNIPGYDLPWEDKSFEYPTNFAPPLQIAIEASNGASDYGNKFGEPVILGFTRSFGMKLPNGERREWIKPIMFSGGIGSIEDEHIRKLEPKPGMEVVKIGGPVYRIGVGGGAASSVEVQGDNEVELDFGAVQRGDAEMEQKLNRVIRACIEMIGSNPICSIHDQGAGGNGNVLKEIVEPAGAKIRCRDFTLGDPTISTLELWGAEYQESDAILIKNESIPLLKKIGEREKVPVSFVGTITGDGRIVLDDSKLEEEGVPNGYNGTPAKHLKRQFPVDLPLDVVLGKMPQKAFVLERAEPSSSELTLPTDLTVMAALDRVLRLPSVASKRFLTNKVDRCVTGLIAQQQCVGPLHTPVADVAVTALTMFESVGVATAIGEQPIKGLIDPARGARMTVGEALTNLVFAQISDLKDVKCSGNWMWAAKLPGEGALLFDACKALCEALCQLGIAIDGGKDSLSMAARINDEVVKCPGELVLSVYVPCTDITKTVTPDLKHNGDSVLVHVKLSNTVCRLGGSALAQVYGALGNEVPDMDDIEMFKNGFMVTQKLIKDGKIKSGHDVSDGGLVTCLLEMGFSGNCGMIVDLSLKDFGLVSGIISLLFAEELGLVLEVAESDAQSVIEAYSLYDVVAHTIGRPDGNGEDAAVVISVDGAIVLKEKMVVLRDVWEATSFQLEQHQANKSCVEEEMSFLSKSRAPKYHLTFKPKGLVSYECALLGRGCHRVAVIREEGSNGDREMAASFFMAGFEVWDITMQDICAGKIKLDGFRGAVFVGGFSYADVLGSAKGWAAVTRFNENARRVLGSFRARHDTFSLGVCNGCQLLGLNGWVGSGDDSGDLEGKDKEVESQQMEQGVFFTHNDSGRFECRFTTVRIEKSPAVMLKNMEGSILGIWVAHGEGKVEFKSDNIRRKIADESLISLRYVDDSGNTTLKYPLNPNGSPDGIAAICSADGRHLAMMPHPERCSVLWQWPWMPQSWHSLESSPWLQIFHNAYEWCQEHV